MTERETQQTSRSVLSLSAIDQSRSSTAPSVYSGTFLDLYEASISSADSNGQSLIELPKSAVQPRLRNGVVRCNYKSDLSLKGSSAQVDSLLWPKKVSNGEEDDVLYGMASVQGDGQSQDCANLS